MRKRNSFILVMVILALLLSACQPVVTPTATAPTHSTKPTTTAPTQPTNPSNPTNPTNPTYPTNPSDPTNPTNPSNPTNPTNPSNPTNPTSPTEPVVSHDPHTDENNDEICDGCGIDVTVELDIYAINDLHGVFMDTAEVPGVDELTTFLKNAYADPDAYEILLASGDMWQGSVESNSNRGQLITEWMNHMGFAAMTLGNHEYDWGSDYVDQNAQVAQFPFLGINVFDANVTDSYCQSSVVVERGGVKIGIIGAIGDVLSSISGDFTPGLDFAVRHKLTELVKAEATRLRQEEGCHLVIYSLHDGYTSSSNGIYVTSNSLSYYDLSLSQGYVDIVFEAHTHQTYILQDRYGVYHMQAGGYNKGMSFANICYNLVTHTYEVEEVQILGHSHFADDSLQDDPIVNDLVDQYFDGQNPYEQVLGRNDLARSSDEIAQMVAQLYLEKGRQIWGDQYDIVLGGGYIKTRPPYDLPAGDVTYPQLTGLLPFDNDLVLCSVSGKTLRERFLGTYYACAYDSKLASGIVDSKTYYIVVDSYTSTYAPNKLTEIARATGVYARDLLKEFVEQGGWTSEIQTVTIAQANAIGMALGSNQSTKEVYQITGVVSAVTNTTYGNVYIQDEQGNTLYLYGLYDSTGRRYDSMQNPPKVGDRITVTGAITKYIDWQGNVVIEIKNACMN